MDLALVVDCSGSIRDTNALNDDNVDNWDLIVDFMVDLVTSINVGDGETHVAAVSFGTPSKRRVLFIIVIIFLPNVSVSSRFIQRIIAKPLIIRCVCW